VTSDAIRSPRVRARIAGATGVAAAAVLAFVVVALYALHTVRGQQLDVAVFESAAEGQSTLWRLGHRVLDPISAVLLWTVLVAAVGVAALRRRWLLAAQAVTVIAGANLTTQLLKRVVLHRPDLIGGETWSNSLPSGHTTAAASVAVTIVAVVPRQLRPFAAFVGAGYTALVGVSTLIGQWHRPSDVICALFVVTGWAAVAAAMGTFEQSDDIRSSARNESGGSGTVTALLVLAAACSGVSGTMALLRTRTYLPATGWPDGLTRGEQLVAYAGGALVIVAVSSIMFAVLLNLHQWISRPSAHHPEEPATEYVPVPA
jgi:membrane-associated phospholipid phosphatase